MAPRKQIIRKNFDHLMPARASQTLSAYRAVHEALDTQCEDTSATILSKLLRELAENYKAETGQTIGEGLGWS